MESGEISVFAYGTLLDPEIQLKVFGHVLEGDTDALQGFILRQNSVAGKYPDIVADSGSDSKVTGMCYSISPEELKLADAYETELYFRKWVTLYSGNQAWVYLAANKKIHNEI